MKRLLFFALAYLSAASAYADSCSAISYQCDLKKKEMRVTFEEKECSEENPFKFFDAANAGLYNADHMSKAIVIKKCALGGTPLTMLVTAECQRGGYTAAGVRVFRDDSLSLTVTDGRVDTASIPIAYAPRFGMYCELQADERTMVFDHIVVRLVRSSPSQQFSVEMK